MKNLIRILLLILTFQSDFFAQCDGFYILCNQNEVDSFLIKNGPCDSVDVLKIGGLPDLCGEISDLSPLLGIKYIRSLQLINLPKLMTLDGLDSLSEVGRLDFSLSNTRDFKGIRNLKKVTTLLHNFINYEELEGIPDLSMYENLSKISEYMEITGEVVLNNPNPNLIPDSNENPEFLLIVKNMRIYNDFSKLIRPDLTQFSGLSIINIEKDSISLKGLEHIQEFKYLILRQLEDIDADLISHIEFEDLYLNDYIDSNNKTVFNLKNLEEFSINQYHNLEDIQEITPNLTAVSGLLFIQNNPELKDLNLFNNFEPPHRKSVLPDFLNGQYNIIIKGNPQLDSCNIDMLCKAIEMYPDSILIEDNGIACNLEEVMAYCETVSSQDLDQVESIKIYPNPTSDNIEITGLPYIEKCELYNNDGKLLKTYYNTSLLNMSEFSAGLYTIRIAGKHKVIIRKVLKI